MLSRTLAPLAVALSIAGAAQADATAADVLSAEDVAAIQAQRRSGAFDDALMTLDDHPAVASNDTSALALRGLVLLDSGRLGAARVIMSRHFRGSRVRIDSITNTFMGRIRFERGELKKAVAAFKTALKSDAANDEAAFMLGAAEALVDEDPAAILALAESGAGKSLPKGLAPAVTTNAARTVGLKRAAANLSDDGTWNLLEYVLEHEEADADLQLTCARVLHRRGESEAADELLDDVAKNRPHRMQDVLFERALAQSESGESAAALETLDGAIRLGKEHIELLKLASRLAIDEGKLDDANRYLSLLEARWSSVEVDRLYARYCFTKASRIEDAARAGDRIVLLRESEKRCIAAIKRDQFHVETLEKLLEVSDLLGERTKVTDRSEVERWLRIAKSIRAKKLANR